MMSKTEHLYNNSSIESLKKKNWIPWCIVLLVVFILIISSIFAVISENKHRDLAKLYANAFVLYQKIDINKPYNSSQDSDIKKAVEALEKPANFPSHFTEKYMALTQIGLLYVHQNKLQDALPFLEKVKQAPKDFISKNQALFVLARIYEKNKKIQEAINIYEDLQSQTKDEELNLVRYQLGVLYSNQKETINKAIEMYEKIQKDSSLKSLADRNIFMLKTLSSQKG